MLTRNIAIGVAATLAILSVSATASAQAAPNKAKPRGAQTNTDRARDQADKEQADKEQADKDKKAKAAADDKGAAQGTSTQAAAHEDAVAPTKAQAIPDVPPGTPAARFGARTQIAISSDVGLSIENTSVSGVDGSVTTFRAHPAIDYFVIDNLSVGGFLGLDYISTPGGSSTQFSIGPRVGYNIAFAERFSIWPKVGLSLATTSQKNDVVAAPGGGTTSQSTSNTSVAFNLFVPVMFHPVEHFFLGFGPVVDADLSGDNKSTTFGGRLTIGGWF